MSVSDFDPKYNPGMDSNSLPSSKEVDNWNIQVEQINKPSAQL